MQIERQDRRAVANQNLHCHPIAIADAMHRLQFEPAKIFVAR
jgi:hypothetical protein